MPILRVQEGRLVGSRFVANPGNARREWRVIGRNASPIHFGWLLKSEAQKVMREAKKAGEKFLRLRRGWSGR